MADEIVEVTDCQGISLIISNAHTRARRLYAASCNNEVAR